MRADRLVATLLVMQARGRVTAAELASELEISVATARRDLEALSTAGIPVYPQPGRGGGWQLIGGARTDLSGLSADEARALFLLVGPAAAVDAEARSALRKLVRALPETFRANAEAATEAIVIDPTRWGTAPAEESPFLRALQDAVIARRKVHLTYRGWDREPEERLVDPWGLIEKNSVWYLLGGIRGELRTFRLDRIVELVEVDVAAIRPDHFDLEAAWASVVVATESQRKRSSATIRAEARLVPYLRELFGERSVESSVLGDGQVEVRVSAPTDTLIARRLSGWADQFEVVGPDSLRVELLRIGAALSERYSS
jgi:predicted DNA-binding transcriptional regulator YafY